MLVDATGMPFHLDPRPHIRPLPKPPYGGPGILRVLVPDFLRAGPSSVAVASTRVMLGDMRERMHALRVPTLLVWGENDPLVPLPFGQAMQQELEGSRLVVIPRAAHVAMWDAPDEFNRVALEFFDEVENAPRGEMTKPLFSWGIAGWTPIGDAAHRTSPQRAARRDIVCPDPLPRPFHKSVYFVRLARHCSKADGAPSPTDTPRLRRKHTTTRAGGPRRPRAPHSRHGPTHRHPRRGWLGHSIPRGCNAVAHLARCDPSVRRAVYVGPL